jgi:hypothetical protein
VDIVYTLTNTGPVEVGFTAAVPEQWLNVTPESGSIPVGGQVEVTVGLAAPVMDLGVGRHESTLQITNTGTGAGTTTRPVTVTVNPSVIVTPEEGFESSRVIGAPFEPEEMVYTLTNEGVEAASFSASVPVSWLSVDPVSESILVDGYVDVTVSLTESAANLGVGRHTSFLEISSTGLGMGTTNRPVLLTVVANVPRITGVVPNPFGNGDYPKTEIRFTLGGSATVTGRIYDIRGGRVKDLGSMDGVAGENNFTWKGGTDLGGSAPSGQYIFILYALGWEERTNIILVR